MPPPNENQDDGGQQYQQHFKAQNQNNYQNDQDYGQEEYYYDEQAAYAGYEEQNQNQLVLYNQNHAAPQPSDHDGQQMTHYQMQKLRQYQHYENQQVVPYQNPAASQGQLVPYNPRIHGGQNQMVLYDPVSGGYFVQQNSSLNGLMDDDYDSEDDEPTGCEAFVENGCCPKSMCGRLYCILCCFLILSAIGIGVVVYFVKVDVKDVPQPPWDPRDHKSDNMQKFIQILETTPNFTDYANTSINQRLFAVYNETSKMGGPITRNMSKDGVKVNVPQLNHLLYDHNLTETNIYKVHNVSESLDRPNVFYDLEFLLVPPPDWTEDKKQAAKLMWSEIDGKTPTKPLEDYKNWLKGLIRIVKYRKDDDIIYIYEGLIDGLERYNLFGRLILNFNKEIHNCVGWFNKDTLYNVEGQAIYYKNMVSWPSGSLTFLVNEGEWTDDRFYSIVPELQYKVTDLSVQHRNQTMKEQII